MHLLPLFALASFALRSVNAIFPITAKGSKFFSNGQQFFIKGVAYQGTPSDPLVDTTQCTLDATAMSAIGMNSIRVYHVDAYANHDGCMSTFADNGIYVWLDLDTFNTSIVQETPAWTQAQFAAFAMVMDAFHQYENLGGFWIGNEVINSNAGSPSAPYIKAAVSDMKAYMAAKNYRTIPIGYSAADIAELRPALQNYLACGSDSSQTIDFYGLNSYEWCGDSTYDTSGYSNLQAMSANYSIPIFFSETGCNVGGPRTFDDQAAIFGPDMVGTWSGSIIYEWVQETNNYGLVRYDNGQIYQDQPPIPMQPDYSNLETQWKTITPSGVAESTYTPSYSPPPCPASTAGGWLIDGNPAIPTLGSAIVSAIAVDQSPIPSAAPFAGTLAVTTTQSSSGSIAASVISSSPTSSSPSTNAASTSSTIRGSNTKSSSGTTVWREGRRGVWKGALLVGGVTFGVLFL